MVVIINLVIFFRIKCYLDFHKNKYMIKLKYKIGHIYFTSGVSIFFFKDGLLYRAEVC